ncbi:Kinesin motor domain-containing protein [Plasmodiophora brassicae]
MSGESVRVVVRCRPFNSRETASGYKPCIRIHTDVRQIEMLRADNDSSLAADKAFTFDAVYGGDSTQHSVFMDVGYPLVSSIMEGYNGTIFAYGQTGCGKTFSMEGLPSPPEMRGIIPKCFDQLFSNIGADPTRKFLVTAAYIEIYNEEVRDLLGDDPKAKLDLKENPQQGVFVQGLTQNIVKSVEEIDVLQKKGNKCRSIGFTKMNADSSRSHSIFIIKLEATEVDAHGEEHIRAGKLNLVDLAGSERQSKTAAEGLRLKEATKINLSLSALGNVISALTSASKVKHIPYRDSKLTRLLQDSLGGNTKTVMLAAISPSEDAYDETLTTLRYANRAKNIKNRPVVNEDPKDAMLRQYQEEINRLKQMLSAQQVAAAGATPGIELSLSSGAVRLVQSDATGLTYDELDRLKQEYQAQHEEKVKMLEAERQATLALQERLRQEWEQVQAERNAMGATGKKNGTGDAELTAAQRELEAAMTENAERGEALAQELQTVMDVMHEEDGMTIEQFEVALREKEELFRKTESEKQSMQMRFEEHRIATEAEKQKMEDALRLLESQLLAGGKQAEDAQAQHVRELREAERRLLEQQQKQDELAVQKLRAEEERLMLRDNYDSLQEEVEASREKVKALQAKYAEAKTEVEDLQNEFAYEREETLETIRQLGRDLDLYKTIVSMMFPPKMVEKVVAAARWDETRESWEVPRGLIQSRREPEPIPSTIRKPAARESNVDETGFSTEPSLAAPQARTSAPRTARPPSAAATSAADAEDRFASLRRIVSVSSAPRPRSKAQSSTVVAAAAAVATLPMMPRWDRTSSVLNQLPPRRTSPTQTPEGPSADIADLLTEVPLANRAPFVVAKPAAAPPSAAAQQQVDVEALIAATPTIPSRTRIGPVQRPLAELVVGQSPSVTADLETIMASAPAVPPKPRFEPGPVKQSRPATATIPDAINTPIAPKAQFIVGELPPSQHDDATNDALKTIPSLPKSEKPKFLPRRPMAASMNDTSAPNRPISPVPPSTASSVPARPASRGVSS